MSLRPLTVLVAVVLLAAACGGDNKGDPEAYCQLIRSGVGVSASNQAVQATDFEQLLAVAPPEVKEAVQELSNTTRGLSEIEEIDQLFDAAFDPDAQAARVAFNDHAVESCGYEGEALTGDRLASSTDTLSDIRGYVAANFAGQSWTTKVRYDVRETVDQQIEELQVTFIQSADGDEPLQACNALGVYVYEVRGGTGHVEVIDEDTVVVQRGSPDQSCDWL